MDIYCKVIDMPVGLRANVVENDDGSYTIFVNAKLSDEMQKEKYKHEINHIVRNDFYNSNASQIEFDAHDINSKEII